MARFLKLLLFFISILITLSSSALPLEKLKLPPGFSIQVYAMVPGARSMTLDKNGIVFVGTRNSKIYALIPNENLTKAKNVVTIAKGLDEPNGVAYHNESLYVAEVGRILRYDNIENNLNNPPKPLTIINNLPNKRYHEWRYIKFGPDDWLYIAIGVPCNVCLPQDPRFGTIMRMQPNGAHQEIYVKGLRNSVGFDWDPQTHHLWLTDNGADWMGDNQPPDKLNYVPRQGMDFGFPYYHGANIPDSKYGKLRSPNNFTPPTLDLPAHVAALGMTFYTGKMFPSTYQNQIFIAEHGSWNRSSKVGYKVIWAEIKNNKAIAWHPFITGWLQGQSDWGRPVDVLVMPDGALLISDDSAGAIYRVSYQKK